MESLDQPFRASIPETLDAATRRRLARRRYVFHSDSGHGWLAVKRADVNALGIAADVSRCSYQRGATVYLEEDRDALLFIRAYETAVGRRPVIREGAAPDRSPIRSYASYVASPAAGSSSVGEALADVPAAVAAAVAAPPAVPVFETRLAKITEAGPGYGESITSPEIAARVLWPYFAERLDCEEFAIVTLDTNHKVTGIVRITRGTLDASLVHPREVFRAAITASAAAVFLVHNHPSGNKAPSREDRDVTRRLRDCGELLGIKVLDHLIVANGECVSLAEGGAA